MSAQRTQDHARRVALAHVPTVRAGPGRVVYKTRVITAHCGRADEAMVKLVISLAERGLV